MAKTYLEINEVEQLEQTAENLRDKLLIRVLFHLGCRISEALALKVQDVDFSNSTVSIVHLKTHLKLTCPECGVGISKAHSFCPKCGVEVTDAITKVLEHRRQRVLPIDDKTLAMMKEYVERGGPVEHIGRELIFGINRHRSWQIVKECAEKAGLPKLINPETGRVHNVSPHKLRDAFSVKAVKHNDSGDGLRMLQEHLGHQSIVTTMKYRKVSGREHRDWYNKLWGEDLP